ncbi:cytochrome P450 [Meredithblackwellia eburnea MCA 4105]
MSSTLSSFTFNRMEVLTAILCVVGYGLYRLLQTGKRASGLPPGPATLPVLGNATHIPPRYAHLYFQKIARQLKNPVNSYKVFGATMIVLNDGHSVREFMDKRSSSSSDRPPMYINNELIARNNHILLANGTRSSLFRRLWNITVGAKTVPNHFPLQNAEAIAVLHNVLQRPDNFYQEMRRYSASLTLSIAYGKRAPTFHGKDKSGFSVERFYTAAHKFNHLLEVGAAPPVDILPFLKYVPEALAGWKTNARKIKEELDELYINIMFKEIKLKMEKGIHTGCWMEQIIERKDGLSDESLAYQGGVMMEGGSDTTSGVLLTFVLCAVLHPEAVAKAQAELDKVIGDDRTPVLDDIGQLPYCDAFIKEVMRWRPVAPAGVPHMMTQDEIFQGCIIPKGSLVIGNTWAVLHDPNMYEEPDTFNPDRFIKNKYGLKDDAPADDGWRNTFPYGGGRRICLGMHLAEASLQTNIPKLLWAFKFGLAKDAAGNEIPVSKDDFEPGHLTAPIPFKCSILPRNDTVRATIEREYEDLKPTFEKFEVSIPVN